MRYGIGYKGSKNGIADKIISLLPDAENFYDLFAGGCAVTHAALLSGKYELFYANDIDVAPQLFRDAINGKYRNETRWISHEDFVRLKDSDPYVRYCWSFGNSGRGYLYSKEVEPWKKALHYARLFNDFSLLNEIGIDTKDASMIWIKAHSKECKEKYIKWYCKTVLKSDYDTEKLRLCLTKKIKENTENLRNYLLEGLKKANKRPCDVDKFLGTNGMAGHYFGRSQWEFPTREVYEKLQGFLYLPQSYNDIYGLQELCESLERLERLESLESLQRLERLQSLESLERLQRLSISQQSYDKVQIKPNSVIYCDIPYRNTSGYEINGKNSFNHEAFYSWCEEQKELVVVSEYSMPESRFECIAIFKKRQTLNGQGSGKLVDEKLFIPKKQLHLWLPLKVDIEAKDKQLLLF